VATGPIKAAPPVFAAPTQTYDQHAEAAFRREVARFMDYIADSVAPAVGATALGELSDVSLETLLAGDYLRNRTAGVLARTTSGLVKTDKFNRANADPVDGGWYESEYGDAVSGPGANNSYLTLNANQITHGSAEASGRLTLPVADTELIVQMVMGPNSTGGFGVVNFLRTSDAKAYVFYWDNSTAVFRLINEVTAGEYDSDGEAAPNVVDKWTVMRLVTELDGSDHKLRGYTVLNVDDGEDVADNLTLRVSGTESASPLSGTHVGCVMGWYATRGDRLMICGRNIVVTDVPEGFKVKVDGHDAVEEIGGTVTLDCDAWALPAATIKLLDGSDVELQELSPSGGIYGGDIFGFSVIGEAGDWTNVAAGTLAADLRLGTVKDGGLNSVTFAIDWTEQETLYAAVSNSSSLAVTFSGVVAGQFLRVIIRRDSNAADVTWPAAVDWGTAGAPTTPTSEHDAIVVDFYAHSASEIVGRLWDTYTLADI